MNDIDLDEKLEHAIERVRRNPLYADSLERPEVIEHIRAGFEELREFYDGRSGPADLEAPDDGDGGAVVLTGPCNGRQIGAALWQV